MAKKKLNLIDEFPIPSPGAKGTDSEEDMFLALGDAVQGWSKLEEYLAALFFLFTGGAGEGFGPMAAVRAFGAVEAFYLKRNMLQAAASVYFLRHEEGGITDHDGKPLQNWPTIFSDYLGRCEKLATIRNQIIHGQVYRAVDGDLFVGPAYHDTRYRLYGDPEFSFRYSCVDVRKFARHFRWNPINIRILYRALLETDEPWPEKPLDSPNPQT